MSAYPEDVMDTARLIAGCVEDDDDCATHEPCAWPCRSQAVERVARIVADRERAAAERGAAREHDARCPHPRCPGGSLCCCPTGVGEGRG